MSFLKRLYTQMIVFYLFRQDVENVAEAPRGGYVYAVVAKSTPADGGILFFGSATNRVVGVIETL